MKIYVASSWRNAYHDHTVEILRDLGHDVYDYRNPAGGTGFAWCDLLSANERDGASPERILSALRSGTAQRGFDSDFEALRACEVCVLVQESGCDAHMEAGYCVGRGKPTVVFWPGSGVCRPGLMLKMVHGALLGFDALKEAFAERGSLAGLAAKMECFDYLAAEEEEFFHGYTQINEDQKEKCGFDPRKSVRLLASLQEPSATKGEVLT